MQGCLTEQKHRSSQAPRVRQEGPGLSRGASRRSQSAARTKQKRTSPSPSSRSRYTPGIARMVEEIPQTRCPRTASRSATWASGQQSDSPVVRQSSSPTVQQSDSPTVRQSSRGRGRQDTRLRTVKAQFNKLIQRLVIDQFNADRQRHEQGGRAGSGGGA